MIDYNKAAIAAAETLVRYNVTKTPVSPLQILEQLPNVIVISYSEMENITGMSNHEILPIFGRNRDAITSIHTENGKSTYIVAYNSLLPFNMVQRALAREMGHIILGHNTNTTENEQEAACFELHLLCPRPLIHAVQATCIRITTDLLANLTGVFDQSLIFMRRIPGTVVPAGLNGFVRSQFMPFALNFIDFYRCVRPQDDSAVADIGTYMDGYKE